MEMIVSVLLGLGLAAACGFRVFVPLFMTSLAGNVELLTLDGQFEWVESRPALIGLGAATVIEIAAYYIPWVDNLLDAVAGPAAVVAGVMISASVITGMDPTLKWGLAIIAGGGAAGTVQLGTTVIRAMSTATTGGFGNFAVSTTEAGGAVMLTALAIVAPLLALGILLLVMTLSWRWLVSRRRRRQAAALSAPR